MDVEDINSKEKSVIESIEDQFDDLFAPGKPDEGVEADKKTVPVEPPVKKVVQKTEPLNILDKKDNERKVADSEKEQPSSKSKNRHPQHRFTPSKTMINKSALSAQAGSSEPVDKKAATAKMNELPPEDSSTPVVENIFKKANEKYKKIIIWEKAKQCIFPFIFTLLIILLVVISMFIGKIIIPDEMIENFNYKKTETAKSEHVSIGHIDKKKENNSNGVMTPSPESEIVETKIDNTEIQNKDALIDKKADQADAESFHNVVKEKILFYPYSVYLGSYGSIDKVKTASADFAKIGLETYWTKLDLEEKGTWFRLFTGFFQTREGADEFIKTNQLKYAESKLTKYTILVGTCSSIEDADIQKAQMEKLGYSTYIINDSEDTFRVYTGAFYQKSRAEELQKDLELKNIKCELVER